MSYIDTLNPQQKSAVLDIDGPLLILAGAGSGKTRVLTCRIAHLIENGVAPWKILAITFTNKAAREMQERVERLVGEAAADVWVSTFHACCARILRRDIEKLGYKRQFTIYDTDDSTQVIKSAVKELQLSDKEYPIKAIRAMISDAKNRLLSPREWLEEQEQNEHNENLTRVYERYEQQLFSNDALDFDDLLVKTLKLMAENPPVLDYYRQHFDYILVDEYQDTNKAQYELVHLLSGEKHNLCVVGDDDQSIYGWRGADISNILDFEKDYPEAKVIKLEQNYRSTGNILDAANQVIAHNRGRKEKVLWTESEAGDKLNLYHALDEREEANFIGRMADKLIKQGTRPGEIAVLYRTNGQSRVIEEAFVRLGIPHRIYGAQRFYDRKEVKDILAYMRVLVNSDDNVSVRRIINEPKRGIGDSTVERLVAFAQENTNGSLMQACFMCDEAGLASRAVKPVRAFAELMQQLTEDLYAMSIPDFTQSILDRTGYVQLLEAVNDDESKARIENIKEFQSAVTEFAEMNPEEELSAFLENAALMSDVDNMNETTGAVTLTTLHSAKGLEFDAVFLAGMEETVFPTYRALTDETDMEEERRLAYVGITRARKRLFMSHARTRMLYNSRSSNQLSRFVEEIPRRLLNDGGMRSEPGFVSRPSGRRYADETFNARNAYHPPMRPGAASVQTPTSGSPIPDIPGITRGTSGIVPGTERKTVQLFRTGDRVLHAIFGKGKVVELTTENGIRKITIEFDNGAKKRFSADVAPIKKLDQ